MNVFIMRGLPGAGKTRWIREAFPDKSTVSVCSADDYRVNSLGEYEFDPRKTGEAHGKCLLKFDRTLDRGIRRIEALIVDNTNIWAYEIAPYVALAEAYGFKPVIKYVYCCPVTAFERNAHSVPASTILAMHVALMSERLPARWVQEIVS